MKNPATETRLAFSEKYLGFKSLGASFHLQANIVGELWAVPRAGMASAIGSTR
jgi:hypothetical protein